MVTLTPTRPPTGRRRRRRARLAPPPLASLGGLPFFAFMAVFLIIPIGANLVQTFRSGGAWSLGPLRKVFTPQYLSAFVETFNLSVLTAFVGGVLGLGLAWALATIERPVWLRTFTMSFSSLASQSGGVTLAYAFIAMLGTQGLLTRFAPGLMEDFSLVSFWGVAVVYLYFQVPLMAVLTLPAFSALKSAWREAAMSLGATRWQYVRDVVAPILWPPVVGSLLVLFANAFAAYATAYALAGGGLNLVPILIGFFISGNVLLEPSFAAALVTVMMVFIIGAMGLRILLERRSSAWLDP
ncbi:ABC transporter permease [Brachybacterium sp. UNK5269]|uniref:ABC transporter permease n=1 Tax=Brachybacterium sp. UNK5269 TaxID=3408576 RepID=UPI003BAE7DAF